MSSSPSMSSNLFFPVSFSCFSCSNFCFAWSVLDAFRLDGREDIFFQTFSPRAVREFWSENRDLSFFGRLAPPSQWTCVCVCASVRARVQRENVDDFLRVRGACFRILNRARAVVRVAWVSDEFALAKKNFEEREKRFKNLKSRTRECSKTAKGKQQKKERTIKWYYRHPRAKSLHQINYSR